jgi:hypothetical protein
LLLTNMFECQIKGLRPAIPKPVHFFFPKYTSR